MGKENGEGSQLGDGEWGNHLRISSYDFVTLSSPEYFSLRQRNQPPWEPWILWHARWTGSRSNCYWL